MVTNCLRLIADDGVASLDGEIARVIDRLRLQVLRADDELLAHTLSLGIQVLLHHPEGAVPPIDGLLSNVATDDVAAAARFLLAQQPVVMSYEPRP